MKYSAEISCPYCGHRNIHGVDINFFGKNRKVVTCDIDEGGCDNSFIVVIKVDITAEAFSIEEDAR